MTRYGALLRQALRMTAVGLPLVAASPATLVRAAAPVEMIETYCSKCHNATDWAGSLAFDTLDVQHAGDDPEVWEKAIGKLRGRLMPPAGERQPQQAEIDALVALSSESLGDRANTADVGHVPIQRLNRLEFAASVKGLLGVEVDPKQMLPTEIEVEGFSNIAGALGVSPSFMEQYLSAARRVAQLAVGEPVPKMATRVLSGDAGSRQPRRSPGGTRAATRHARRHPLHARLPGRRRIPVQLHRRRQHRHGTLSAWAWRPLRRWSS